jgi:hypothetical protein
MQLNFTNCDIDKEFERKQRIKKKAGIAINALLPEWKQLNLLTRAIELADTEENKQELDNIRSSWAAVKAIRTASDKAEINGTLSSDFNP